MRDPQWVSAAMGDSAPELRCTAAQGLPPADARVGLWHCECTDTGIGNTLTSLNPCLIRSLVVDMICYNVAHHAIKRLEHPS